MVPGPPLDEDDAAAFQRMLDKGSLGAVGLSTDDCRKTHEELTAKGVEFIQEPADRPYGVEAILRDNSGNWLVLVEQKTFLTATTSLRAVDAPLGSAHLEQASCPSSYVTPWRHGRLQHALVGSADR